jgi:hypothetical protein
MKSGVVQQMGTPTEIYDRPANTFVAGFIGNPAMNLLSGVLRDGVFEGESVRVPGLRGPDGPVTLGFRAEDASLGPEGEIVRPPTPPSSWGDATMITVRARRRARGGQGPQGGACRHRRDGRHPRARRHLPPLRRCHRPAARGAGIAARRQRGPRRPTGRSFVTVALIHPARNRLPRDFLS